MGGDYLKIINNKIIKSVETDVTLKVVLDFVVIAKIIKFNSFLF